MRRMKDEDDDHLKEQNAASFEVNFSTVNSIYHVK